MTVRCNLPLSVRQALVSLAGVVTVLLAGPTPAYAQLFYYAQEARHLPAADPAANKEMSEVDRGRITMINFAGCLIKYDRRAAMSFLTVFPGTPEFRDRAVRLAKPICLKGGALKFNEQHLRGSLFVQLYAEKFGQSAPPLRAEPINYVTDIAGQDTAKASAYVASRQFVECVARAAPTESRDVVMARIGSSQDDASFKAITPFLGPCLLAGAEVKLSRPALSGLMAEVLYRLSTDASFVSVAGNS